MARNLVLGLLLVLAGVSAVSAQGPRPRRSQYSANRPAISPYLYLSRGSVSGVPAYYAWVRPQLELAKRQQFVDSELDALDRQILREPIRGEGEPHTAATFMDTGHFYPRGNMNRGR